MLLQHLSDLAARRPGSHEELRALPALCMPTHRRERARELVETELGGAREGGSGEGVCEQRCPRRRQHAQLCHVAPELHASQRASGVGGGGRVGGMLGARCGGGEGVIEQLSQEA
eukprot:2115595-Rhodomonas_salina.2